MATKKKTTGKNTTSSRTKKSHNGLLGILRPEGGWKNLFRGDTLLFIISLCLLCIVAFMLLAFTSHFINGFKDQAAVEAGNIVTAHNYGGRLGAQAAHYFIDQCFGVCAFFIPLFLIMLSMKMMGAYKVRLWKWFLNFSILMIWGSIALSIAEKEFFPEAWLSGSFKWGGGHGDFIRDYMTSNIGLVASMVLMLALAILYLVYITDETITIVRNIFNPKEYIDKHKPQRRTKEKAEFKKERTKEEEAAEEAEEESYEEPSHANEIDLMSNDKDKKEGAVSVVQSTPQKNEAATQESLLEIQLPNQEEKATQKTVEEVQEMAPYDPREDLNNYKFPPLSLLKKYENGGPDIDMAEQTANKDKIVTVLRNFGVEITGIRATIGPTITLYEVTPAPGVRISKIRNLSDDLALNLSAVGVRIIAPIPGKGTIGIEVPNKNPKIVSMESILNSKRFQETKYELPIALGKTITNEVFMVDLAKMPHLLVAGATGQGKSVGLNAIITSLLYKKHPSELKIVMVDPKKVEFSVYGPIENYYLAKLADNDEPIITDPTKVVQTLKSLCQLMDHRYDLLKMAHVRNVKEYNAKFKARRLNPEKGHEFMPYIVVIIDEFGDLIMTSGKEVELPIARIAQLARAVGIHMVIATQRPTTNIITGTIKANFPARMAFKVSSMIDSRTILDRPGANQLVGRGDMLFLSGNEPVRVQCAFVDTPEVERINEFISEQQGYPFAYELPEVQLDEAGSSESIDSGELDPLFNEVARLIVASQEGSTSKIQRKFSIGYNRAGRLMDQMERCNIVGPSRGSKPREVLVPDEIALEALLETLR